MVLRVEEGNKSVIIQIIQERKTMKSRAVVLTVLISIILPTICFAGQISPQLQSQIEKAKSGQMHKILLALNEQADIYALDQQLKSQKATLARRNYQVISALQEVATLTQPRILAILDDYKAKGQVQNVKPFWLANLIALEATESAINALANLDDIGKITIDYPIELIEPIENIKPARPDNLIAGVEQGLVAIHAPEAWALGYTGAGRVVSNLDTGVDGTHPALAARFRGDVDGDGDNDESWYDPYTTPPWTFPRDSGTHGTHTMGTICGRTPDGDTIGVAIDAQWIASACIDRSNDLYRTIADALAAFQWIADPDGDPLTQDNPDACGNSWGIPDGYLADCDETFWVAIDNVEAAGTVVIFSAGNEGSSGLRSPADRASTYYNCFSVGAINGNDPAYPIAYFSALGPSECAAGDLAIKPEVVAPGVNVRSSVPGGGYALYNGTSMASPHVTGCVAVIRQANPNLDANTIKEILMATAEDLPEASPNGEDNTFGHGLINLYQAVLFAQGYGNVDGYITDASTSAPIPGKVNVMGLQVETHANPAGYYILGLPADTTFNLKASYFGYLPQQQSVYVIEDETTNLNFSLTQAPSAMLQGTVKSVTDDNIANAEVSILDTPIPPETTNASGFYQFATVPSGSMYRVQVKALGYSQGLDSILVQNGITNILDFSLWPAESFEYSNGGYSGAGQWQWGVPTYGPSSAWSGTKLWGTVLDDEYANNVDDNLISPEVFISSSNARLEFYHWYNTEISYDGGNVAISTNGGINWTVITPDGGYPDADISAFDNLEPGYTGSSDWTPASFDLSAYNGQNVSFRWRFGSDGSLTAAGWYIDDVVIIGATPPEPPDMSYDPTSYNVYTAPGGVEIRNLTITNDGDGPLYFMLDTEMYNRLNLNNGKQIPINTRQSLPDPIGYHPASAKAGAEPYYPPVVTDQGGPDIYGYSWIDSDESGGPAYSWVDITSVGTIIEGLEDDTNTGSFSIGFTFNFYGNDFSSFRFCTNGFVSFTSTSSPYSNGIIPTNGSEPLNLVAPFWDDLDFRTSGTAYYYTNNSDSLVVSWVDVPHFSSGGPYTFQIILQSNGKITYQYQTVNDPVNSATIGIQNSDGSDGLQVAYNAAYLHNSLAVNLAASPIWLSVSPASGTVPPHDEYIATVRFDAADLDLGVYLGNINLGGNDPAQPDVNIPVNLEIGLQPMPLIGLNVSSIVDTVFAGYTGDFELLVSNIGLLDLTYTLSDNRTWISESPVNGVVAPSTTDTVTITFNASMLPNGNYTGTITVGSDDPTNPQINIPVQLAVITAVIPDIQITPTTLEETVTTGTSGTVDLLIGNNGIGVLSYSLSDNRSWLLEQPDNGNVAEGEAPDTIQITLDASALTPGTYAGTITAASNDPDESTINISVVLHVVDESTCDYVPGDINGDGNAIGGDITYGVNFFRGGPPPPDICQLGSGTMLFVAGDANGDCSFTGSDITYLVNFFRGANTSILWCDQLPPANPPISAKPEDFIAPEIQLTPQKEIKEDATAKKSNR